MYLILILTCTWVWSPAPNWSEKAEASLCLPACQREPLDLTGICILHSVRGARWSSIQYLLCDYFSPPRMSKTFPLRARRLSSRTLPWTSQLLSLGTSQFHLQGWRWKQNALWQKKSHSQGGDRRGIFLFSFALYQQLSHLRSANSLTQIQTWKWERPNMWENGN